MRTIGLLLGIPEEDQVALRESIDEGLRLEEGTMPDIEAQGLRAGQQAQAYADYIEWRADNPSDDLMTQLLQAEFEDLDGQTRSEEHTSELQSLMRNSYGGFCLQKKNKQTKDQD